MRSFRLPSPNRVLPSFALLLAVLGSTALRAQTEPREDPTVLSPFVVQTSNDDGYTVRKTLSATRLATDISDLPFTLNALSDSFLKDIGAFDIGEALRYLNVNEDSSVAFSSNVSSSFVTRGLPADVLLNGFQVPGGFVPTARVAVDRIEVLEGPASLLYGTMDPGGVINIVAKRPTVKPRYAFETSVGDEGVRRGSFDVGGPLLASGLMRYRLLASDARADSHIVAAGSDRVEIAPMLEFNFTPATTLNVQYNYVKNRTRAIAANGPAFITLVPQNLNAAGAIRQYDAHYWPWDANTRGPGNDAVAYNRYANAELRHHFNATWDLRLAYAYLNTAFDRRTRAPNTLLQPNPSILQTGSDTWAVGGQTSHFAQADLAGKWTFPWATWTLLAGVSYDQTDNFSSNTNSTAVIRQNPLNPSTWAIPVADPSTFTLLRAQNTGDSKNKAVYTTHQFSFFGDRLLALVGGRWQGSDAQSVNRLTNSSDKFSLSHNTFQAGLVAKLVRETGSLDYMNAYTSWSESFVPQNQTLTTAKPQDASGQPLPGSVNGSAAALPIEGEGYEAGLKSSFAHDLISASACWFQVERSNIVSTLQRRDANGTVLDIYQVQGGREQTRGEQLNLSARLFDSSVNAIVNYTHFDSAKLVQYDGTPAYVGKDIADIPEHQLGFFVRYTQKRGLLKGAFAGVGGQFRTGFELSPDTSAQVAYVPGYTLLNAVVGYHGRLRQIDYHAQVNISNLTNRQVILGLYRESDPRAVVFTFGVNF